MSLADAPLVSLGRPPLDRAALGDAIARAQDWLLRRQDPEGWWRGELEADATLESYFILLRAFLGSLDDPKIAAYAIALRGKMLEGGGFAQYPGGPADVSISTLAYLALKIAGLPDHDPALRQTRQVIIACGGVERANSYTKYHLALFGQYRWQDVPAIPPEMIFLPAWGPFCIYDMSSWSRTIFVPLSIIYALKPVRELPRRCHLDDELRGRPLPRPARPGLRDVFLVTDAVLKAAERLPFPWLRRRAVQLALQWIAARLEGSDGLGAILPAMTSTVIALCAAGHPMGHPLVAESLRHLADLELRDEATGAIRVQPCLSPVWDTCLAVSALAQSGLPADHPALHGAARWLLSRQCLQRGDWAVRTPALPGGWCFEHRNDAYPDVDDTCMALMALGFVKFAPADDGDRLRAMDRGIDWMLAMQNPDGGWASFDRGNDKRWLTAVPFADHNAMIDPSTADITGRVLESLDRIGMIGRRQEAVTRAVDFLKRDQELDGAWFGRWGVNYIYGTWQAIVGLRRAGEPASAPCLRRAAAWLEAKQRRDGGWGESIASYEQVSARGHGESTPSQTAWALMGLRAAGRGESPSARRGLDYLLSSQTSDGTWSQRAWTGTGFPRVFYLNYHLYRHYFPLMALGQYADTDGTAALAGG
jgi:squalene-hopene/tetraprenyl-beta-curcumene cyclase